MFADQEEYARMAEVESEHWWYRSLQELVLKQLATNFSSKNIKIIDAGCGTGGLILFLKKNGYADCIGFDLSETAVAISVKRGLNVFKSSVVDIKEHCAENSANVIICNDVFYFLNEIERRATADQFHRILVSGGIFIMNLPALKAFRGTHDISVGIDYRFNRSDIPKIFDNDKFNCIRRSYWPFFLSPIIFLARYSQRIKLKRDPKMKVRSDVDLPSKFMNKLLFGISSFGNKFKRMPWGSSLFVVMKKK